MVKTESFPIRTTTDHHTSGGSNVVEGEVQEELICDLVHYYFMSFLSSLSFLFMFTFFSFSNSPRKFSVEACILDMGLYFVDQFWYSTRSKEKNGKEKYVFCRNFTITSHRPWSVEGTSWPKSHRRSPWGPYKFSPPPRTFQFHTNSKESFIPTLKIYCLPVEKSKNPGGTKQRSQPWVCFFFVQQCWSWENMSWRSHPEKCFTSHRWTKTNRGG
jgi:hypothetical protein